MSDTSARSGHEAAEPRFDDQEMPYAELLRVVRSVRNRWRTKVALRGLIVVLGVGFLAFAASVSAMNFFLYSERAVSLFRWLMWIALAALTLRFLVLPVLQRVSNRQVALYIEEHEPSLQSSVLSAVELGEEAPASVSPKLQRRLLESAIERCEEIDYAHGIERAPLRKASSALAGIAGAGALAVLVSPAFLQHGALLLFAPWKALGDQNPYRVMVAPGDIEVPRGSDQRIAARTVGFDGEEVRLLVRFANEQEWQRWPMTPAAAEGDFGPAPEGQRALDVDLILLDVEDDAEYMVEAGGVASDLYRLSVVDIPYVDRIDLVYRFPEYTRLTPEEIEDGGDIAVLRGTRVELRVVPTVPVAGGWLRIEGASGEQEITLEVGEGGVLQAAFDVAGSGYYRIDLEDVRGKMHRASPEYGIEALDDQRPVLRVTKPGRDVRANKIEEIFIEAEAEDDYGLGRVEIVTSTNGEPEQRIPLYRGGAQKKVKAGHTLFLEELGLQDGDFVSYYVEARDGNRFGGSQTTTSDIYFIEIRPFDQEYRRAEEGGGGMGGAGGGLDTSLSMQQRQIIAATFKLERDRREFQPKEWTENLTTVALSQGRLREQVETLMMRMQNRAQLLGEDDFQKILTELEAALPEMREAEQKLGADRLGEALQAEQRAMTRLQRAESVFRDVRVSFQQGGGGGGSQQLAEDLADLFELELDKLRNQYEVVQRGREQQVENEVDELQERLKELARRQQQENERRNRMRGQPTGGSGGDAQQQLTEEAEELARRLERLAREQSRPELQQTAKRLRDAANEMRRAQAGQGRSSSSTANGIAALDRLREARRLLDKSRNEQFDDQMEELQQRAENIEELEQRISSQIDQMAQQGAQGRPGSSGQGSGRAGDESLQRILERKDRLHQELSELEDELDRLARHARGESPDVARKLQDAANSIRKNQVKDKVRYSKAVVENRDERYARAFESEIEANIDELMEHLEAAQASVGESDGERREDALGQARDLVESLESLEQRLREQQESADGAEGESTRAQAGERGDGGQGEAGEQRGDQAGEQLAEASGESPGERGRAGEGQGDSEGGSRSGQGRRLRDRPGQGSEGLGQGGADRFGEGSANADTSRIGPSDGGGFQPGMFGTDDLRQISKELRQRLSEARDLRQNLREQGLEVSDLDDVMRQMQNFNIRGLNNDPLALDRLREQVVEGLRQFEFRVWRELESGSDAPIRLTGDEKVPPGYEERVEEYFRSLARSGG